MMAMKVWMMLKEQEGDQGLIKVVKVDEWDMVELDSKTILLRKTKFEERMEPCEIRTEHSKEELENWTKTINYLVIVF